MGRKLLIWKTKSYEYETIFRIEPVFEDQNPHRSINMWNLSKYYKLHLNLDISVNFYPRNFFDDLFPNTCDKRILPKKFKKSILNCWNDVIFFFESPCI